MKLSYLPLAFGLFIVAYSAEVCWWTGCQKNDWAVRGCEHYNRTQSGVRECEAGNEYYCCPGTSTATPPPPSDDEKTECWWSPCQPTDWAVRGCPGEMKEIGRESCGEDGDMYNCCGKKETVEESDVETLTGGSITNYVKYLMLKSRNFTLEPDSVPCLSLDTDKESILKIKNQGIYMCDLCPYFPQKRLVNILHHNVPFQTEPNLQYPECFGSCFNRQACVALSYDHVDHICYLFNNTVGTFDTEDRWTTVLMTQPVGIIEGWTYSRHTSISGEALQSSEEKTFQICITKCENIGNCNHLSYEIRVGKCDLFSTDANIRYVDLNYGFVSATRISSIPVAGSDVSSRFIETGDDLQIAERKEKINDGKKCSDKKNATHSAYFSRECLVMSASIGCDASTGCKSCYYPENTNAYVDLPICPDSQFSELSSAKRSIHRSMLDCLSKDSCVGVGYRSRTGDVSELSLANFPSDEFSTKFLLRYPKANASGEDQTIMAKYDFLFNYDIAKISSDQDSFLELAKNTYQDCLNLFQSKSSYIRMSYSNGICKISTEEVQFVYENGNTLVTFKKPPLTSNLIRYIRTPGLSLPKNKAQQSLESCKNCEVSCAIKCNKDFKNWCSHFSIETESGKQTCRFFNFLSEKLSADIKLQQDGNSQIFTKLTTLDFTLHSLNQLNPFQSSDIYSCFKSEQMPEQTLTSLAIHDSSTENTSVSLRRKRGFWDAIGNAFKKVGEFVVDTVKDVVEPIIDTAKGVANSIKNVVEGDLDAAKESFMNIPIVQDVKNVVDLGGAVISGDWDTVKERGIDLLQSHALDLATSLIPVGGKFIGKGLKTIGKQIKKTTSKVGKSARKNLDKASTKNKKVKRDKDSKSDVDNKRNHCTARPRRDLRGVKRKQPHDCRDHDEEDDRNLRCTRPNIRNVIESTMSGCLRTSKNAICEYECLPGYEEPRKYVRCENRGNRAFWSPTPNCDLIHCDDGKFRSVYPLIALNTPHISSFGSIEFGKHLTAYVVLYEKWRKLPIWSIALHQSDQFASRDYTQLKNLERADSFKKFPCPELSNYQGRKADYANSNWDQGHLTPANVARWSPKAVLSTNLYINVAPQDPYSNRGPWQQVEAQVECFSKRHRSLVVTGICEESIGKTKAGGLDVPSCFWKMVCYKDENNKEQVVGFYSDNSRTTTAAEKLARAKQIYEPRSQIEMKRHLSGRLKTLQNPWIKSASEINKGRAVQVGALPTVWFPVNPYACSNAAELSQKEIDAWNEALTERLLSEAKISKGKKRPRKPKQPKNDPNKKPKTGRKRQKRESGEIRRGCGSVAETRNMLSFLNFGLDDEETDGDSDEDDEDFGLDEASPGEVLVQVQSCNKRIVGYYTSWGDKLIEGRQLERLTHVIYAFLEMKPDGTIEVGRPDRQKSKNINEEISKAKDRLVNLMKLASLYPHLKVMFAVGGWENSQYFSSMAASPENRITFIASAVKMIQRYGFDGIDIDWEYPVTGGAVEGVPQDKQNYVLLMKEMRQVLDNLAAESGRKDKYLLSFAGAAGQWTLDPGYDLKGMLKYADFANIMSYDFFGAWASKWGSYTGPPAPLHFAMPIGFSGKTNVDWTVKHYTCKTGLPHKINMGVPFYGRYWKNVGDPVDKKDGMWRTAQPVNGKYDGGYVPWNKLQSEFLNAAGFEKHFHEKSKTPYAWNAAAKTFLGYEDERSLEYKVKYAEEKNVGGLMIWALEQDDDDLTLLDIVSSANLCKNTNPNAINFKCSPIDEKRWWTPEDGEDKAGLCGKSAPLYKGYYPVCDPDDPGYSCCGPAGYCGHGPKYCDCPTCKDYGKDPKIILEKPIKPSVPVTWYFLNDEDGKRGRCGRKIPKLNNVIPTCNPDDENNHCCSNGGYCGSTKEHCQCNGCIDFKENPNFRFGPKKWWNEEDSKENAGKCGPNAPKFNGYVAECEPNTKFNCCSENGYCGSGPNFCDCPKCRKFT